MNKRGAALIMIAAIFAIFTVLIVYYSTTKPFYVINDNVNASMTLQGNTRALTSLGRIDTVWRWFPLVMILGIVFWLFLKLIRRQQNDYYGGGQY